jgi:MoaA/NifB/PqqE/SkfB family radical SAM enzyme
MSRIKRVILHSLKAGTFLFRRKFLENINPEFLWIETTDACNSQCIFCNIWRKKPSTDLITPQEIENILKENIFRHLKVVIVSGGEPMLRPDIKDILTSIHRAVPSAWIVISSNGILSETLIDTVKFALENQMCIHAGISLDGIGDKHDQVRGIKGLFNSIDFVLRELMKLKKIYGDNLAIAAGFTLSDATISEMEAVKKYTEAIGVDFNPQWYSEAKYYENIGNDQLSKKQSIEQAVRKLPPTVIRAFGLSWLKGKSIKFSCFSMFNFCLLKCEGDVVPCFKMWDTSIGNIRKKSMSSIWRSKDAKRARRLVKNCQGCLSACGVEWSLAASYFPRVVFNFKHAKIFNGILIRTARLFK